MKKIKRIRSGGAKSSPAKMPLPLTDKPADPCVVAWKKEKNEAHRFPSIFELNQIAAILSLGTHWQKYWDESDGPQADWSVAAAAYSMWEHCGRILDDKIGEAIHYAEMSQDPDLQQPDIPDWIWARHNEEFPLAFDKALEHIIGKKIRKSDRYAQFRAFMRALIKDPTMEEEKRVAIAEKRFIELKEQGFSTESFEKAGKMFDAWKATQAKQKAQNAAMARWKNKKKTKKSLGRK